MNTNDVIIAYLDYIKDKSIIDPISVYANSIESKKTNFQEVKYIVHVCNNIDRWGIGLPKILSDKWPSIREFYHIDSKELGDSHFYQVENNIVVVNMIAQHGIRHIKGNPPIRYEALTKCLESVVDIINKQKSKYLKISVHMPRIGCGLAGGDWDVIEPIIINLFIGNDISVVIYD